MPLTQTAPISDEQIRLLVGTFYGKVRADADLAPIFERVLGGDWEAHLAKMYDFWSSVILTTGFYKGSLVAVHKHIGKLEIALFDRYFALFGDSCDELLDSHTAGLCWLKAVHIAESLKLAMFDRPDRPWLRNAV